MPTSKPGPFNRASTTFAVGAALAAAYAGVLVYFAAGAPLQDAPNHLARAAVAADLLFHHGGQFSRMFAFEFRPVSYVLCDLVLAGLVGLFGIDAAAAIWNVLVLLSLPIAVYVYLRSCEVSRERCALALILALYLSTDWFFVKGFFAFRLAVALVLLTVALARTLRVRWSTARYGGYVLLAAAGYLVHLTSALFAAGAVGIGSLLALRPAPARWRREIALMAPLVAVLAWQSATARRYHDPVASGSWVWGSAIEKLVGATGQFLRYSPHTDLGLLLCLAACVAWPLRRGFSARDIQNPFVLENLLLALAFGLLYLCLPVGRGNIWFMDARAMEMAALFFILCALVLADSLTRGGRTSQALVLTAGTLLAAANLAYLVKHFRDDAAWLRDYRSIVADVPPGSTVLPVYNAPLEGTVRPLLHAGSFLVIDRQALTPYLFSADTGDPMTYFRYVQRPYAPSETWYRASDPVDWRAVECGYEYLLVMAPFEPERLPLPTATIARNRTASLLKIAESCAPMPAGVMGTTGAGSGNIEKN